MLILRKPLARMGQARNEEGSTLDDFDHLSSSSRTLYFPIKRNSIIATAELLVGRTGFAFFVIRTPTFGFASQVSSILLPQLLSQGPTFSTRKYAIIFVH